MKAGNYMATKIDYPRYDKDTLIDLIFDARYYDMDFVDLMFKRLERLLMTFGLENIYEIPDEDRQTKFSIDDALDAYSALQKIEFKKTIENAPLTRPLKKDIFNIVDNTLTEGVFPSYSEVEPLTRTDEEKAKIKKIYDSLIIKRNNNYRFIIDFWQTLFEFRKSAITVSEEKDSNSWRLAYALQSVRTNEIAYIHDLPIENEEDLLVNLSDDSIQGISSSGALISKLTAKLYAFTDMIKVLSSYYDAPSLLQSPLLLTSEKLKPELSLPTHNLLREVNSLDKLLSDDNVTNKGQSIYTKSSLMPKKESYTQSDVNAIIEQFVFIKTHVDQLKLLNNITNASQNALIEAEGFLSETETLFMKNIHENNYQDNDLNFLIDGITKILTIDIESNMKRGA